MTIINRFAAQAQAIALEIHQHPEICNEEYFAQASLSNFLEQEGFTVTRDVCGHPTGFDARYVARKPGPTLVFLAEYDALPGLGHACGHNLFGVTSCLAAIASIPYVDQFGGEIRVYGTPGEEGGTNGSAKGSFVREGYFTDVDAALCVHPGYQHGLTVETIANAPIEIEFFGKASHAAVAPEAGINALDALIQTYNSINALRQHLPKDALIHGVILNGGEAPNIVPDYARARFYIRANHYNTVESLLTRIRKVVEGAALATGCKYRVDLFQNHVEDTITTPKFDALYLKHLNALGHDVVTKDGSSFGSSDVGNVSHVVPTIQPTIDISEKPIIPHTPDFAVATQSQYGLDSIILGATLLSNTAHDLLSDPALLHSIQTEHKLKLKAVTQ